MSQDLITKRTRSEFQEWLIKWTLRTIKNLFDRHNIKIVSLSEDLLPSGERRSIVECYYASIDWSNIQDVRLILNVYEDILIEVDATDEEEKQKLIRYLEKDGYAYNAGRIVSSRLDAVFVSTIEAVGLDIEHLHLYVDRINSSIETDPSLAIGSTKELIEATLKTILNGYDFKYDDKKDDIPKLLKYVQKILELAPDDIDGSKKGSEAIKKVLSNLGSVAIGIAELRNLYGSGHGKGQKSQGLTARHAKLVVGSGITFCTFLLETYEDRNNVTLEQLRNRQWQQVNNLAVQTRSRVRCINFHPNSQFIASGDEAHMVTIWKLDTGEIHSQHQRFYYNQSSGDVNALVFSHDGSILISTGFISGAKHLQDIKQHKIQLLNWITGEVISFFPNSSNSSFDSGISVALCANRDIFACNSINNVELYDLRKKQHVKTLVGHLARVTSITFSPDSKVLASSSEDGQIRIWNWQNGEFLKKYSENSSAVNTIAISPDSKFLAAGNTDNKIIIFNLITEQIHLELAGHSDFITSVAFNPDGQIFASGSKDDTVKIWHLKTGELLHNLEQRSCFGGILAVTFSPDGQILATGSEGGEIKIWHRH